MPQLQGTQTETNLLKAFAGESQAVERYTMFAKRAKQEGLIYLATIFLDNANMERHHAQRFFSFLEGRPVKITATYPAGRVGSSEENLKTSIEGEIEESQVLYP
jgi:rubrerythrin